MKKSILNEEIVEFIKELYPSKEFIPLHAPEFSGKEKEYVMETIETTYVSSVGKFVDRFEEMMQDYTGSKYAIAVVNGTAALHMALMLANVKQGDMVLTQALSFIATCNAISYIGAEPVFIDVDKENLGLSYNALNDYLKNNVHIKDGNAYEKQTGKKIAACVPMHTFGFPCEIDKIVELCNAYFIPVIEDAAESIGTKYKGKHTGTFGLLGTFSFNGNKTITCGGGGIIVTDNESIAKLAKHLTTQAKVPHKWEFVHDHIGYNYRCPNLNSALACAQLERLDSIILNKRVTASDYQQFFEKINIKFTKEPENSYSNYWLNSIMFENEFQKNEFLEYANSNGVMSRPIWALMTELPMFKHCKHDGLENSIEIGAKLVNIPSSFRPHIISNG